MKTRFFLLLSLLLVPMVTLCEGKPATKVIIYYTTLPPSTRTRLEEVAIVFQGEILQALSEKYPCLETITATEAEALVGWKKNVQLLGLDEDLDFANHAAGGLGIKYAITLTASALSAGQYLLGASTKPGFLPDLHAGGGNLIGSSDDAVFAGAKAEAKRFADSLSSQFKDFTKENCDPTNRWTGEITYRRDDNHEDTSERKAISGEGTVTNKAKRTGHYEFTITLPMSGPPRSNITARESVTTAEEGKARIDCGRGGIAHTPAWKSAGWMTVTSRTANLFGSPEPKVTVTIGKTAYEITVSVPEIEGKEEISISQHGDGGCGKPSDKNPSLPSSRYAFKPQLPKVKRNLDVLNQVHFAGGERDELGGYISWDLTLTPVKK